jgi:hypothetical protein
MKQPIEFAIIVDELRKEGTTSPIDRLCFKRPASFYISHRKVTVASQPFRLISPVSPENVSSLV